MATDRSTDHRMLVEVNERLADELVALDTALANLKVEATGCRGGVLNDTQHYDAVTDLLERLTVATLSATPSVSLRGRRSPMRARFDMGTHTNLAKHVNACVTYLRDTASELLAGNSLSAYKGENVDTAMSMLLSLRGQLLDGIRHAAVSDLRTIMNQGAGMLLYAANDLADYAATKAPVDIREASLSNPDPRSREEREGSWNPAG